MNSLLPRLITWNPLSVIIVSFAVAVIFTFVWYAVHFADPPSWVINIATLLASGALFGTGTQVGSNANASGNVTTSPLMGK